MNNGMPKNLLTRLRSGYALPALSPIALKLVELASDDTSSAKDLAKLIEQDPALTVRLLKLANSAFFRTSNPISSLAQAVVRIGLQRLRIMALSISLRDTFPFSRSGALDFKEFWRISLYRALIAKSLAEYSKVQNPDEAFVAGFITEIGLLIFFDLFIKGKGVKNHIILEPLEDLLRWETDTYGVNHRQVGKSALTYWKFPEPIILCQTAFKKPAGSRDLHPLARLYEQARVLSRIITPSSEAFHLPFEEAQRSFGLEQSVINDILVATFEQVQDIANDLSVEMNQEKDLMEIVEKANSALSRMSEKLSNTEGISGSNSLPSFESIHDNGETASQTLQAVVHEIRNPLSVVGGLTRKLAASIDPNSTGGNYIQIILKEASRLENALSEMVKEKNVKK